jgi:DNA-binding NarL/FixJ family response regulator
MGESLRVVVAVGPRIYREGLAEGIQRRSPVRVTAAVGSTAEAVQAMQRDEADVVLLDTSLAGAASFTSSLASCERHARVVALAIGDTETDVCGWAALGVAGFLTTDDSLDDLTQCVAAVARGEFRCSPRHASMLLRRVAALSHDGLRHVRCRSLACCGRGFRTSSSRANSA